MNLHEQREEQARQQWHSRLARERLDLSESVDATLADTSSQEDFWTDEYTISEPTSRKMTLIPPRLSLQSRMLPAVRSNTSDMPSSIHTDSVASAQGKGEQKAADSPNILTRLAQRFTSSLAALGGSVLAAPMAPTPLTEESQESFKRHGLPATVQGELSPALDRTHSSSSPIIDALPSAHSPVESSPPVRSKQRLAGHTGKIRLQTASLPAVTPDPLQVELPFPPAMSLIHEGVEVHEPVEMRLGLSTLETEKRMTTASIPRVDVSHRERREELPEDAVLSNVGTGSRGMLSGSGMLESGQCDVLVPNTHIRESSVVVVTLTSNPGPVVVQYVSLQPKVGFTIHLTAPAAMRTSFNYVILLGELF
jgi:hypothetical protein